MRYLATILLLLTAISMKGQESSADLLARATASFNRGDYSGSIAYAESGIGQGGDHRLLLVAGESFLMQGETQRAKEYFLKAEAVAPGSGSYLLALVAAGEGNSAECVRQLRKNLESPYKRPQSDIMLEKRFSTVEKSEEWKSLWRREWYTELDRSIAEMKYLVKSGRYDELMHLSEKSAQLYGGTPGMAYLRGVARKYSGDYQGAIASFGEAVEGGITDRELWTEYAGLLVDNSNYIQAAAVLRRGLEIWPADQGMMLMLTRSLAAGSDSEAAAKEAALLTSLYPNSRDALILEARVLLGRNEFPAALRQASKAIEKFPGSAEAYVLRGDIYNRTGTWQYAVSDYSMSLDLSPGNGDVYFSKGMILIKTGNKDDGCRDLRMAMKYGNRRAAQEINRYCIR